MSLFSLHFIIFLILGIIVYYSVPIWRRKYILLILSYVFYSFTSITYALMLLIITSIVYYSALIIDENQNQNNKNSLAALIVASLALIIFGFKSANYILQILTELWGDRNTTNFIVPLGVSYYLFKLIGYLLDVFWGKMRAERSFVSISLYVSFFPQIISGPIQRADDFLSQLNYYSSIDVDGIVNGLRRILFGLFKKFVIADPLVIIVAGAHSNPASYSSFELTLAAYCFALQLYADFSAITDIAIGIGQLFGIKGPENFKTPFFASNIQDFWRRWHISLTSWLSDYLFTPLRMVFRNLGEIGLVIAIFINMIVVGIWHDLKWTFLVFGVINGIYMTVSALTLKKRNIVFRRFPQLTNIRTIMGRLITFHLIVFAFIFFRANSIETAFEYVMHLTPGLVEGTNIPFYRIDWAQLGVTKIRLTGVIIMALIVEAINWASFNPYLCDRFLLAPRIIRFFLIYIGILLLTIYGHLTNVNFIYQQF